MGLVKFFGINEVEPAPTAPPAALNFSAAVAPLSFESLQVFQPPHPAAEGLTTEVTLQAKIYRDLLKELKTLDLDRRDILERLKITDPKFEKITKRYLEVLDEMNALREVMTAKVRELRVTVAAAGITVEFQDPKRTVFDGEKLLKLYPEAASITGLIGISVDKDTFNTAVAAGRIPQHVAAQVMSTESVTKAGRVEFKAPKE